MSFQIVIDHVLLICFLFFLFILFFLFLHIFIYQGCPVWRYALLNSFSLCIHFHSVYIIIVRLGIFSSCCELSGETIIIIINN